MGKRAQVLVMVCLSIFVADDLILSPTSNKVCHRRRWRMSVVPSPEPGLHLLSFSSISLFVP